MHASTTSSQSNCFPVNTVDKVQHVTHCDAQARNDGQNNYGINFRQCQYSDPFSSKPFQTINQRHGNEKNSEEGQYWVNQEIRQTQPVFGQKMSEVGQSVLNQRYPEHDSTHFVPFQGQEDAVNVNNMWSSFQDVPINSDNGGIQRVQTGGWETHGIQSANLHLNRMHSGEQAVYNKDVGLGPQQVSSVYNSEFQRNNSAPQTIFNATQAMCADGRENTYTDDRRTANINSQTSSGDSNQTQVDMDLRKTFQNINWMNGVNVLLTEPNQPQSGYNIGQTAHTNRQEFNVMGSAVPNYSMLDYGLLQVQQQFTPTVREFQHNRHSVPYAQNDDQSQTVVTHNQERNPSTYIHINADLYGIQQCSIVRGDKIHDVGHITGRTDQEAWTSVTKQNVMENNSILAPETKALTETVRQQQQYGTIESVRNNGLYVNNGCHPGQLSEHNWHNINQRNSESNCTEPAVTNRHTTSEDVQHKINNDCQPEHLREQNWHDINQRSCESKCTEPAVTNIHITSEDEQQKNSRSYSDP